MKKCPECNGRLKLWKLLTLTFIIILSNYNISYSQISYSSISEVCYKKGELTLTFRNCTDSVVIVPLMNLRTEKGSKYLHNDYWTIKNDILELKITPEISPNLYKLINREGGESSGKLFFIDKKLKPGKKIKTTIKIDLPKDLSKVKFDEYILPLCRN